MGGADAAFAAVSDAVLAASAEASLEPVLRKLVEAARDLVGARYAALGVPDEEGTGFSRFLTAGMTDEEVEAVGPLPRTHGLLGAMLADPTPYRTDDVTADPRFWGWPAAHPEMRSFLGVPIVFRGDVIGAFYLTDKEGADGFDAADQRLIEVLAAHAAVAMENARLFDASRELGVAEERNRLARDLHDTVTQTLFSLSLTAEAAASSLRSDPARAEAELAHVRELARTALGELRSLINELRPVALEAEGLVAALGKRLAVLGRANGFETELRVDGEVDLGLDAEVALLRIAQEALSNAVRHARARTVCVELAVGPDAVTLVVRDDGRGFDPDARAVRARRLGLTSMRERAAALGGTLAVESAPGAGTAVRAEVPR